MNESIWSQVTVRVQPEAAEFVADLLSELTGSGVSIEPPIEALGPDEGYTIDESAPMVLRGYVYGATSRARRDSIRRRLQSGGAAGSIVGLITWRDVREEDWAEAWKEYYDVDRVGNVVIRPEWREYEQQPGDIMVHLDPGMAFGTGQHPTTRMCLLLTQEFLRPDDYVLDLGCGSAILAIAAIALGARACVANDTEEQAVKASTANVKLNDMADRIKVLEGSIDVVADLGPYDMMQANINANTIIALCPEMFRILKPGREAFCGGVIREREPEVRGALESAGFIVERVMQEGEWRTLVARKPSSK